MPCVQRSGGGFWGLLRWAKVAVMHGEMMPTILANYALPAASRLNIISRDIAVFILRFRFRRIRRQFLRLVHAIPITRPIRYRQASANTNRAKPTSFGLIIASLSIVAYQTSLSFDSGIYGDYRERQGCGPAPKLLANRIVIRWLVQSVFTLCTACCAPLIG